MAGSARLTAVLEQAAARRRDADRLVHAELGALELFGLALSRQKLYLAWTAALSVIHLLELWVLIRFHFAFPPAYGLAALRIISSLSLLGLLAALAFRWADFQFQDNQRQGTLVSLRLQRLSHSARWVFLTAAVAALLVAVWIILFSRLQLSSAPAFRAVIFNGILGLPIDVTASYLLYLSGRVGALPVSRKLRWLGLGAALLSLVLLASDFPLLYLLTALAPRVLLLSKVWRNISGANLTTLVISPPPHTQPDAGFIRLFVGRFYGGSLVQIGLDLAFLLFFSGLTKFDTGIALLLYLVHKSAHLAQVLTGKAHATFSAALQYALLLQEKPRLRGVLRTLGLMAVSYSLVAFLFAPLFLLQRQALAWLSPLGETVSFDWQVIWIGLILTFSLVVLALCSALLHYIGWLRAAAVSAAFVVTALFSRYATPPLVHQLSFRQAFFALALVQCVIALIALGAALSLLLKQRAPIANQHHPQLRPLIGILQQLGIEGRAAAERPVRALLAVSLVERKAWQVRSIVAALAPLLARQDAICIWGNTLLIAVARADLAALTELRLALAEALAGSLRRLRFQICDTQQPLDVLQSVLHTEDVCSELYRLACGRNPGPSNAVVDEIMAALTRFRETNRAAVSAEGLDLVNAKPHWDLEVLTNQEVRLAARSFLRRVLQGGEFIFPLSAALREYGAFLLYNVGAQPALLLHLHAHRRESLAALRFAVFRANLLDALTEISTKHVDHR